MEAVVEHKDPAAEAAVKMRTDCVYFLASPLTCKKGIKCEYRHSEAARLNPIDCWYWVNRKCLNPNCSFRHPPLEAFLGNRGTAVTTEPPSALSQPISSMAMPAPLLVPAQGRTVGGAPKFPSKQSVPCYYFQQGYCKKDEMCPFLHGPQPASVTFPPSQPPKTTSQPNTSVPVQKYASQNDTYEADTIGRPEGMRNMTSDSSQDRGATSLRLINSLAAKQNYGYNLSSHVSYAQGANGLKSGEILRSSSPSFDVLVDRADGKLYRDEEDFRHNLDDGSRLDSADESQYVHSSNFNGVAKKVRPDWKHNDLKFCHMRSSDRSSGRDNRSLRRPRSPEGTRDSDLRNRLSKQRRTEWLPRSDNGPNYEREGQHTADHRYDNRSHRDQYPHFSSIKSNTSSCLQGRLKLTAEVYNGRSKILRRSNKVKQNGLPDRRVRHSVNAAGKLISRRHDMNKSVDFTAPKTLAELKGAKDSFRSEGPTSESNKRAADGHISIQCPKPLEIIFQRKQGNVFSIDGTDSSTGEAKIQVGSVDVQVFDDRTAVLHAEPVAPLSSNQELGKVNDIEAGDDDQIGEEAVEEEEYDDYNDGDYEYVENGMEVDGGYLDNKEHGIVPEIEAYTELRAQ